MATLLRSPFLAEEPVSAVGSGRRALAEPRSCGSEQGRAGPGGGGRPGGAGRRSEGLRRRGAPGQPRCHRDPSPVPTPAPAASASNLPASPPRSASETGET